MKTDQLYNLLPSAYRTLDADQGDQLRGLMAILQTQFDALQDDVTGLYKDWFIETCGEWAVPYIADLLGLQGVEPSPDGEFSMRAFVANTLYYRARKGTVPVIEEIARDLADEPAKAIEYFRRLSVTQQMNHVQLARQGFAEIRESWPAHLAHTAFESSPHFAEVRRIAVERGRYNIPNIGVDLWRTESFFLERTDAFHVMLNQFMFDPLGREMPIFNRTRSELDSVLLPSDVPEPLAWRPLFDELTARRAGSTSDTDGVFFGSQPVLQVFVDGIEIAPEDIYVASLEPWRTPSTGVAIDVVRGRLSLSLGLSGKVETSFSNGWPGEVGAMPYDRRRFVTASTFQPSVIVPVPASLTPDLATAIATWDPTVEPNLLIQISGNPTFTGDLVINKPGGTIRIEAANASRPVILGTIKVPASSKITAIELEGVLVSGGIEVHNQLQALDLAACTLYPGTDPSIRVDATNLELEVTMNRCFTGRLALPRDIGGLTMADCLVLGNDKFAIRHSPGGPTDYGPATDMRNCTVVGPVSIKQGTMISECILTDLVQCERVQTGCTRYSFVPLGSRVPRRFHCQPYDRYSELKTALGHDPSPAEDQAITDQATRETTPQFVSEDPTSDAFLLLTPNAPCQVATGAEDEGEMGGWHCLFEQRRMRHLDGALADYVRFGLEAGVFRANKH